jgi:hypothetical protein
VEGANCEESREERVDFGTNNMAKNNMAKNSKFRLGQSGNPETMFKPGNRHRWQPGQSGNPSGIGRRRLKFEELFYAALIEQGTPEEAASLLWECARAREPWAVQAMLQRLAPQTQQIKFNHEADNGRTIDFTKLSDGEIEQLAGLMERAASSVAAVESGESQTEFQRVRGPGLGNSGA